MSFTVLEIITFNGCILFLSVDMVEFNIFPIFGHLGYFQLFFLFSFYNSQLFFNFFFFNIYLLFLKNYLFVYLFIFGCVGSSFLCEGFL